MAIRNNVGKMKVKQINAFLEKYIQGEDTIKELKEIIKHVKNPSTLGCDRYAWYVIMDAIEDGRKYIVIRGCLFTHDCHLGYALSDNRQDVERYLSDIGETDSFARYTENMPVMMVLTKVNGGGDKYYKNGYEVKKTVQWKLNPAITPDYNLKMYLYDNKCDKAKQR